MLHREDILAALRSVQAGQLVVGPGVAERLLGHLNQPVQPVEAFPELTPREREILGQMAAGAGNASIAERLVLAPGRVDRRSPGRRPGAGWWPGAGADPDPPSS